MILNENVAYPPDGFSSGAENEQRSSVSVRGSHGGLGLAPCARCGRHVGSPSYCVACSPCLGPLQHDEAQRRVIQRKPYSN
jgi:hypothetical protein